MEKSEIVKLAEEKVDLIEYFNKEVVTLKPTVTPLSKSISASICPLHNETDPSFHIYEKNGVQRFKCFGCGASGNVVDLYRSIEYKYHNHKFKGIDDCASELLKKWGIDVKPAEISENVFQNALKKVKTGIAVNATFNFAKFRELNSQIRGSNLSAERRAKQYEEIDRMATSYLMNDRK